jgi:hypothetical protein
MSLGPAFEINGLPMVCAVCGEPRQVLGVKLLDCATCYAAPLMRVPFPPHARIPSVHTYASEVPQKEPPKIPYYTLERNDLGKYGRPGRAEWRVGTCYAHHVGCDGNHHSTTGRPWGLG